MLVAQYVPGYVVDPWGKGNNEPSVDPNDIAVQVSLSRVPFVILSRL